MNFVREQIKEKPVSKKKLLQQLGVAALCGLSFALAACIVVLIFMPSIKASFLAEKENTEENSSFDGESEDTDSEKDSQVSVPNPPIIPDFNLSLEEYEKLQGELYSIGTLANKSVVTVTTLVSETDWLNNAFETEGQGSGVLVMEDSNYLYVLTEKRVVPDESRVSVTFIDNSNAEAMLLKYDGNTGIAILAVEKSQLSADTKKAISTAVLGNSYTVKNGSLVLALGSPLGTNYSILTGNITSTTNEVVTWDRNYDVFTTDIVGAENGSGILINTKGEVIGMVLQSFRGSQDANTLTAVSISEVKNIIEQLAGNKDMPHIGLHVSTVTDSISEEYKIPKGVFIKEVKTDSPAMFAGLQSGDVIIKVNGGEILQQKAFSARIQGLIPGSRCEITVLRQNGTEYVEVSCEVEIGILK